LTITDLKYVRSVFDSTGNEYFGLDDVRRRRPTETGTPTAGGSTTRPAARSVTAYPVGAVTFTVRLRGERPRVASNNLRQSSGGQQDTRRMKAPGSRRAGITADDAIWIDLARVVYAYVEDSDNFAAAERYFAHAQPVKVGTIPECSRRRRSLDQRALRDPQPHEQVHGWRTRAVRAGSRTD
jgi:hypothetical protein